MTEMDIKAAIRLAIGRHAPRTKLFQNPCGHGWMGDVIEKTATFVKLAYGRPVTFGLFPGSADLIGWTSVTITPDMVGQTIAVFTSPEVKTADGRTSTEQRTWRTNVRAAGGIADVVRSPEEALRLVGVG